jgi:hypothetical protein
VSCYLRYMDEIFVMAGITVTKENKKRLDETIHKLVGTHYKNCSATWSAFKKQALVDEASRREFARRLKEAVESEAAR